LTHKMNTVFPSCVEFSGLEQAFVELFKKHYRKSNDENCTYELLNERLNTHLYAHDLLTQRTVGLFNRPVTKYAACELLWYLSQNADVDSIPFTTPALWRNITADNDGEAQSQYGKLVFERFTNDLYSPFVSAVLRLLENSETRRSIISYAQNAQLHDTLDKSHFNFDAPHDSPHDFLCTMYTTHVLLDTSSGAKQLQYTVHQRSCDAVLGFKNDYAWHRMLMLMMYFILSHHYQLNDRIGFCWLFDSLHVYHRDVEMIKPHLKSQYNLELA